MIDGEHSAVVALHRLSLPERNGGVVVEDNPVSALMRQAVVDDGVAPRPTRDCFSVGDSLGAPPCRHHARPRAQRGVFGISMSTASAET
jgi:hypothetical protein